ncbi:MAG: hypothetical protein M1834_008119 [Cirrosporium novae-zelandiae]|nr:MAG: hypothetical protein M1834_008119 [Cirrosporium novae-zelandiae]
MPEAYEIHPLPTPSSSPTSLEALDALHLTEISLPTTIPANHSLIRLSAIALNYLDLLQISSSPAYPIPPSKGLIPCNDGAGTVVSPAQNHSHDSKWVPHTPVIMTQNTSWLHGTDIRDMDLQSVRGVGTTAGMLTQYKIVHDSHLVRMPRNLTPEEAATLPVAGGTAMHALFFGPVVVKRGDVVLTQGTGGVSCWAIQLAIAAGATVVATSSSDEKLEIAKRLGAKYLINYRKTPEWEVEARKVTGGKGVDFVVDVGGSGTIKQSLAAVRTGGAVSVVGVLTEGKKEDLVPDILFGGKIIRGVLGIAKAHLEKLVEMVEEHDIHPVIAQTYPWAEAKDAFRALMKQQAVGKIVIRTE